MITMGIQLVRPVKMVRIDDMMRERIVTVLSRVLGIVTVGEEGSGNRSTDETENRLSVDTNNIEDGVGKDDSDDSVVGMVLDIMDMLQLLHNNHPHSINGNSQSIVQTLRHILNITTATTTSTYHNTSTTTSSHSNGHNSAHYMMWFFVLLLILLLQYAIITPCTIHNVDNMMQVETMMGYGEHQHDIDSDVDDDEGDNNEDNDYGMEYGKLGMFGSGNDFGGDNYGDTVSETSEDGEGYGGEEDVWDYICNHHNQRSHCRRPSHHVSDEMIETIVPFSSTSTASTANDEGAVDYVDAKEPNNAEAAIMQHEEAIHTTTSPISPLQDTSTPNNSGNNGDDSGLSLSSSSWSSANLPNNPSDIVLTLSNSSSHSSQHSSPLHGDSSDDTHFTWPLDTTLLEDHEEEDVVVT